jgi:hypothetical protein
MEAGQLNQRIQELETENAALRKSKNLLASLAAKSGPPCGGGTTPIEEVKLPVLEELC